MRFPTTERMWRIVAVLLSFPILTAVGPAHPAWGATYYVDPVNGNNAADGLSPAKAWKTPRPVGEGHSVVTVGGGGAPKAAAEAVRRSPQGLATEASLSPPRLHRLVLGAETVGEWEPAGPSTSRWKAGLDRMPGWVSRTDPGSVETRFLDRGCAPDFLGPDEWFWDGPSSFLYVRDADPAAREFVASIFDRETGTLERLPLRNWMQEPPTVFQAGEPLSSPPIHLMVDGELYPEKDWWWGPRYCPASVQGEPEILYLRSPGGDPDATGRKVEVVREGEGWSATSGDFNGDGFRDVVTSNLNGRVFVHFGGPAFTGLADQVLEAPGGEEAFGFQVASAGDVNGDGYDDLLVALNWGVDRVYLFWGSGTGFRTAWAPPQPRPFTVIEPPPGYPGYGFGHSLAAHPGDINRDGLADILIGVGGEVSYLCVYFGNSSRNDGRIPDQVLPFPQPGSAVQPSHVGDLNRDGYGDIAVSPSRIGTNSLSVLVYKGSRKGVDKTHPVELNLPAGSADTFRNLFPAPAGDLNNDGYDDLIVGNQWAAGRHANEGKSYIYYGSRRLALVRPDITVDNPVPGENARFGASAVGILDFDHDGYNDFMVGCPYSGDGGFGAVYCGPSRGARREPALILQNPYALGWSMAHVGNLFKAGSNAILLGDEFGTSFVYHIVMDQWVVRIDIKPNDSRNIVKRSDRTAIPVAIFGSGGLNVRDIDVASLSLQGLPPKTAGKGGRYVTRYRDIDRDGFMDLLISFSNSNAWPVPEDGLAVLSGNLYDQTLLLGRDLVSVAP